ACRCIRRAFLTSARWQYRIKNLNGRGELACERNLSKLSLSGCSLRRIFIAARFEILLQFRALSDAKKKCAQASKTKLARISRRAAPK
ncbi:hypothetical protein, partial [uncultured Campylobacter sp.]|uniref:hypothetical protein n=1 Tax=uncultured Campylobacter sp. TaxID=218934 RepID=UPI00260511B9